MCLKAFSTEFFFAFRKKTIISLLIAKHSTQNVSKYHVCLDRLKNLQCEKKTKKKSDVFFSLKKVF